MRSLSLAFTLTLLAAPILEAQSALDLSNLREAKVPISSLNQPDRHEILHRLQIAASQLRAEALPIGAERLFVVQGSGQDQCSPTGNCSFWIFGRDYKILLNTTAQQFRIQSSSDSSHPDIVTAVHCSAYDGDLKQWHFDGTTYQPSACASYTYKNSFGDTYARARITSHPCPHY
jgi:hypothetical protein